MKTLNFNRYTITWAILIASKGHATKKDIKTAKFMNVKLDSTILLTHAPNKECAINKVLALRGKLSKSFKVIFITDKQFGMVKNWNFQEVATKKQLFEMFYIN